MKINNYIPLKETKSRFLSLSLPNNRKMGKVHSVFKTSFNIIVDGHLLNFSSKGMSLSAHGCILNKSTMDELLNACKPGDIVRIKGNSFTFYTPKDVLKVDVSKMEEIDLSIPKIQLPQDQIAQLGVYSALQSLSFDEEMGLENEGQTHTAFHILQTLSEQKERDMKESLSYLIGRGKGLTPSGDDILIGYTMVRKAFKGKDTFEKLLEKELETKKTTDISKAYYEALFEGFVSSLFVSLILCVENATQEEARELMNKIGLYGHTSGYDTLFGFYLGLQSLINETGE